MELWEGERRRGSPKDRGRGRLLNFPDQRSSLEAQQHGWLWRLWHVGPGLVTGASDLDPSAVITATVVGAAYQLSLLWVVLLCVPLLLALFSVTARIGVETRKGVLDLVRENYGRGLAVLLASITIFISMAVIIADLMAVSEAFSVVLNVPRAYMVAVIAFSVWYVLIFRDYRRITKALVIFSLPLYVYVASAFLTGPGFGELLHQVFVPALAHKPHLVDGVVALFGSLLTPYIVLWQTSSRSDPEHQPHRADAYAATLVAAVLGISIMIAAASVLHLSNPADMTIRQAAEALRPAVGSFGTILFAIGIIGSGLVALPVLVASMCYDLAQAMGWRYGLSEHPWEAKSFYMLISVSMIIATLGNFININPIKALYWSMLLAGLLTVPTFLFILIVSNDRRIMRTTNTWWENFWVGAATGGSAGATILYLGIKIFGK
ncbi:MAG TPA: divalent metal cation transporter [Terriglobales bacterium]|nr:divalent metal cation transporter [Terriglobales bacterium]